MVHTPPMHLVGCGNVELDGSEATSTFAASIAPRREHPAVLLSHAPAATVSLVVLTT
jgi:hypothetical protein